jgi:hypothetical protein
LNPKKHFKEIDRLGKERIGHDLTVVEILEYISSGPIGIIITIDEIEGEAGHDFEYKSKQQGFIANTFNLKKPMIFYQDEKKEKISKSDNKSHKFFFPR